MLDVRVLEDPAEVAGLRAEWEGLYRRTRAHLFLAPAWVLNWWRAFGPGEGDVRAVVVRGGEGLVGMLPLRLAPERRWGASDPTLRLWADVHANRAGPLVDPSSAGEVLGALARALDRDGSWRLAALDPVPLDEPGTLEWATALESEGFKIGVEPGFTSPYMRLPESDTSAFDTVSPSFRRNLKRKLNRAERAGCRVVRLPAPEAAEAAFEISRSSWQHANGTGLDTTPTSAAFFRGMIADPWLAERVRIPLLMRGSEPVAYEWNLLEGARLYNLKVGYHPDAASLSPGLVLRHHTVAEAVAAGLEEFDFLGSVEPYKMHWATGTRRHGTLLVFRGGLRSTLLHSLLFRARPALKRSEPLVRLIRALRG